METVKHLYLIAVVVGILTAVQTLVVFAPVLTAVLIVWFIFLLTAAEILRWRCRTGRQ